MTITVTDIFQSSKKKTYLKVRKFTVISTAEIIRILKNVLYYDEANWIGAV